jgi:glycosyltransferase involved in cell wall biosynthesis
MTRVSVAMTVRDVEAYVDEALDSVLDQAGPDDEVVVVDDGSADATPDRLAARGDRIVVVPRPPEGLSVARNVAVDHATGRFLTFVDGDDRWAPGALDRLVAGLEAHPEATGVLGETDEFLDPSVTDPAAVGLRSPATGVLGHFLGAMLLRREILDAVRFDAGLSDASTPDWLARARDAGLVLAPIDGVVLHRRLRPGSMTADGASYQGALLAALRAKVGRERQP